MLTIESSEVIAEGRAASLVQDSKGDIHLFYVPSNVTRLHYSTAFIDKGDWQDVVLSRPLPVAPDLDVLYTDVIVLPGDDKLRIVWQTEEYHRFAVHVDDGPQHALDSPYRLYYAVDTEKLYMNISETWQFIGSPKLNNLEDTADILGEMSDKISALETEIDLLKGVDLDE